MNWERPVTLLYPAYSVRFASPLPSNLLFYSIRIYGPSTVEPSVTKELLSTY